MKYLIYLFLFFSVFSNKSFAQNQEKTLNNVDITSFSIFYKKVYAAFKSNDFETISKFIHPTYGFYSVFKPGMFHSYDHHSILNEKWTTKSGQYKYSDLKLFFEPNYIYSDWFFNYSKENKINKSFKKNGAYISKKNRKIITSINFAQNKISKKNLSEKEQKLINTIEFYCKISVLFPCKEDGCGSIIDFMNIDGNWYIGIIDLEPFSKDA